MELAARMARLGTETAFEVLAAAKAREAAGHDVIHLEIGEPDFDTPEHIVEAAVKALRSGAHHYTPATGIREFREVIAREITNSRGIPVEPDQVVVTPGGKPIIFFSLLALAAVIVVIGTSSRQSRVKARVLSQTLKEDVNL